MEVVEGVERELHVAPPSLSTLEGRVARWDEVPSDVCPVEVWVDGYASFVRDGRFAVQVLEPAPELAYVRGPGGYTWTRPIPLRSEGAGELVLDYPFELLERCELAVSPRVGGRIVVDLAREWREPPPHRILVASGNFQSGPKGGPVVAYEASVGCAGWVRELADGRKLLRGWFELGPGLAPAPGSFDGRFVTLHFDEPDRVVELELEGPELARRSLPPVPAGRVDSTHATEIWIPAAARALLVHPRGGIQRRIPLGVPTDQLEISLR